MISIRRSTAVVTCGLATLAGLSSFTPAAHAADSAVHGCPSGAVCIYPENAGWNNDHPSVELWSGIHNLSNEYGSHIVLNNQYATDNAGYWSAVFCYGYAGPNPRCSGTSLAPYYVQPWSYSSVSGGSYGTFNLTPINSISLYEG